MSDEVGRFLLERVHRAGPSGSQCADCSADLGHTYEPGASVTIIETHEPRSSWRTTKQPNCKQPRGLVRRQVKAAFARQA